MNSEDPYTFEKAKKRVLRLKQFYEHLIMFIILSTALAGLNFYQNSWENPWFLWGVICWLIAVLFHALFAFDRNPVFGRKWEEKKISEFMKKKESKERWH